MPEEKQLSNPFSIGGGGTNFETHIQAMFTVLMVAGGVAPCLPPWPIKKIKLQGRYSDFNTDDCILFAKEPNGSQEAKLLAQIKHSINITEGDKTFGDVIRAAWHDFCDPNVFNPEQDSFALITGPLSATDIENVRMITEWARSCENATEFITKVEKANFSSDVKRSKLKVFRFHLEHAKGAKLSDEELWRFIKRFHLLAYDLDVKSGADLALLHSIINQFGPPDPHRLWTQVVDEVQSANQNAGTLNAETIAQDILKAFTKRVKEEIPQEFVKHVEMDLSEFSTEIALAMLLGSWDESVDYDKKAAEKLSASPYGGWINKLRNVVLHPEAPLIQRNRKWKVDKRLELWNSHGSRIFDEHLDRFKEIVVSVFREPDPKFELPKEERFAAGIHGKVPLHSQSLRNGLAESIALLGSHPKALPSCSLHKPEVIAALCVREVLDNADWVILASLSEVLPLLAEAEPNEFLNAVEKILNDRDNKTFRSIFAQEGSGIGGWNYMTGVLWALETLAWHPDYLTRVTILLGQLAEIDPGGNWANRPVNSLTTIFLPWHPQTCATIEKRKLAVEALLRESPEIGWKLLLSLLPHAHQVTSGTRKPKWQELISKDCLDTLSSMEGRVSNKDYFDQLTIYAALAEQNAISNLKRLEELVNQLDDLPNPAYSQILAHLSSKEILDLPEQERLSLWEALTVLVNKHRKFSDAKWALPATEVDKIVSITNMIKPTSPNLVHRRLFSQYESELYEEKGNFEEQRRKIEDQRTKAIEEIFDISGINGVIDFAKLVSFPLEVGLALGRTAKGDRDTYFLPSKLTSEDKSLKDVTVGYIWSRFNRHGWKWADGIELEGWTHEQKVSFLALLPFTKETWERVQRLLGDNESLYWKRADARPYQLKDELHEAVEKLLHYNRPRAAIQCLNWMLYEKISISVNHVYRALLDNLTSQEPTYLIDQHACIELIKWLQIHPDVDVGIVSRIEWSYLPLLEHHFGLAPKTLERRLAEDPEFFCEVIRVIFRSDKEKKSSEEPTEEQKRVATNAYDLLYKWRTPPGSKADGSLDATALKKWLEDVKCLCGASGHLRIALDQAGKVLAHSPTDPNGLWIHKGAAEVLNEKESDVMRSAFTVELLNQRDFHTYTAGEKERALALSFREKADAVEKDGYFRLAASLRELADSYDREAEREGSPDPFED